MTKISEILNPNERVCSFKVMILFMGCHKKAAFLNQLYYWSKGRTKVTGGWIAKSYSDWYDEILVEKRVINSASKDLKKTSLLETKIKKYNRQPTLQYRLDVPKFEAALIDFVKKGMPKSKQKPRGCAAKSSPNLTNSSANLDYHKSDDNSPKGSTNLSKGSTNLSYSKGSTNLSQGGTNKERRVVQIRNTPLTDTTTETTQRIYSSNIHSNDVFQNSNESGTVVQEVDEFSFQKFWDLYDLKQARKKVESKWKRMKVQERKKVLESLPRYFEHLKKNKWKKKMMALTYLNQERWEDEFEKVPANTQDPKCKINLSLPEMYDKPPFDHFKKHPDPKSMDRNEMRYYFLPRLKEIRMRVANKDLKKNLPTNIGSDSDEYFKILELVEKTPEGLLGYEHFQ